MDQLGVARRSIGGGCDIFVSALRSGGSKLPRHGFLLATDSSSPEVWSLGALRGPAGINPLGTKAGGGWLGSALAAKNNFPADEKKTLNSRSYLRCEGDPQV